MESVEKKEPVSASGDIRMEDIIILKLHEVSFEVKKEKLSKESLYFNSLFSGNFSDSWKKEIDIEYMVDLETFKTFVEWLNDETHSTDIWGFFYNKTLSKYEQGYYKEMLALLRFASFYAVDNLLDSLEYIIVHRWLQPENLIELWLIAEELSQEKLKKAAFARCLDLFELLPQSSLFSLSNANFEMLVQNVNIRCSTAYQKSIVREWAKLNKEKEENQQLEEEYQNIDSIHFYKNTQNHDLPRVLHCVTTFETNSNTSDKATVFSWNGTDVEVLAKMFDKQKTYTQAGTQILGRGYSIYVVGGETFLGHGKFNFHIMRYCLLTQKWYKEARLLEERRHMVAAFLGNKLILVGGVGKFRVKLTSVHILDIHTGIWSQGQDISQSFTDIPPSCVIGDKLFVAYSGIHSYSLQTNTWSVIVPGNDTRTIKSILHQDDKLFALVQIHDKPTNIEICMIDHKEESNNDIILVIEMKMKVGCSYNLVSINDFYVWFIINNGRLILEIGEKGPECYTSIVEYTYLEYNNLCFKPNVGCFSLLNPHSLFLKKDDVTI